MERSAERTDATRHGLRTRIGTNIVVNQGRAFPDGGGIAS